MKEPLAGETFRLGQDAGEIYSCLFVEQDGSSPETGEQEPARSVARRVLQNRLKEDRNCLYSNLFKRRRSCDMSKYTYSGKRPFQRDTVVLYDSITSNFSSSECGSYESALAFCI